MTRQVMVFVIAKAHHEYTVYPSINLAIVIGYQLLSLDDCISLFAKFLIVREEGWFLSLAWVLLTMESLLGAFIVGQIVYFQVARKIESILFGRRKKRSIYARLQETILDISRPCIPLEISRTGKQRGSIQVCHSSVNAESRQT